MSRAQIPPLPNNPLMRRQTAPLDRALRQLSELSSISGGDGILAQRGPNGTSLLNSYERPTEFEFYAVIVNAGPGGAADFTDARYWVRSIVLAQLQNAAFTDTAQPYMDQVVLNPDGTYGNCIWLPAINLSEAQAQTHSISPMNATGVSSSTAITSTATLVRVYQIQASKLTNLSDDSGNSIFVFDAISSGSGGSGNFPVTVKQNGVDGAGNPLYDLYAINGTTNKLNIGSPLAPYDSRARLNSNLNITGVPDYSYAEAYRDAGGVIGLWDVPETLCSSSGGGINFGTA